jgi:phage gpG-like protein
MAKDKFNFEEVNRRVKVGLENSLVQAGVKAVNHFKKSFRDGGFTDNSLDKWPSRKSKKDSGRAILVKSGNLRRSIHVSKTNKSKLSLIVSTSGVSYAKIHNEGGTGLAFGKHPFKMPKRQFIGGSYKLNEDVVKIIKKNVNLAFK